VRARRDPAGAPGHVRGPVAGIKTFVPIAPWSGAYSDICGLM